MPADIVTMRDCASNYGVYIVRSDTRENEFYTVTFSGESGAHCTCKAWQYSGDNHCKHVNRVYKGACMYNAQYNEGNANLSTRPQSYTYDAGLSMDMRIAAPPVGGRPCW